MKTYTKLTGGGGDMFVKQLSPFENISNAIRICREIAVERNKSEYRHHSALAKCTVQGSVLNIDYTGAISGASMKHLDRMLLPQRMASICSVESQIAALTMLRGAVDTDVWTVSTPPSASIVRPDQFGDEMAFSRLLEKCGVYRSVWLPHQKASAHDWLVQFQD